MSTTKPDAGGADAHAPIPEGADDEISLMEMLQVLWARKWLLIGSTLGAGVLAAGVTLLMPNYYTATARILPPQQNSSSASALLGQLGGLAAAAGGSIGGIRNPNDLYVGMLKSRTVADQLIEKFDLQKYFEQKYRMTTQTQLASVSRISAGKEGIIAIAVELKDPKLYRVRLVAPLQLLQRDFFCAHLPQSAATLTHICKIFLLLSALISLLACEQMLRSSTRHPCLEMNLMQRISAGTCLIFHCRLEAFLTCLVI